MSIPGFQEGRWGWRVAGAPSSMQPPCLHRRAGVRVPYGTARYHRARGACPPAGAPRQPVQHPVSHLPCGSTTLSSRRSERAELCTLSPEWCSLLKLPGQQGAHLPPSPRPAESCDVLSASVPITSLGQEFRQGLQGVAGARVVPVPQWRGHCHWWRLGRWDAWWG